MAGEDEDANALLQSAYRPLRELLARPKWRNRATEFTINGPRSVQIRLAGSGYEALPSQEVHFLTKRWFRNLCHFMAVHNGLEWSDRLPLIACRTPDGHRFQGLVGPNVESGMAASLRVVRMRSSSWDDFECSPADRARIEQTIAEGNAIWLSGGTGSGKTTFLNMLLNDLVAVTDRVVTIEDTREIQIPRHVNRTHLLVSRSKGSTDIGWGEAIDVTLRLNPTWFIPGELAIASAFPTLQVFDTGHRGAMTTMHANSPMDAMRGFRRRVALGGGNVGSEIAEMFEFFAENIGLIIQIKHMETAANTERRVVTQVISPRELLDSRTGRDAVRDVERDWDRRGDLVLAREVLGAMRGGARPSAEQEQILAALTAAGLLGRNGGRGGDGAADDDLFSPEEKCQAAAAGVRLDGSGTRLGVLRARAGLD